MILELLEIPQLMNACVRNGSYDEALDLKAFAAKIALLHPNVQASISAVAQVSTHGHIHTHKDVPYEASWPQPQHAQSTAVARQPCTDHSTSLTSTAHTGSTCRGLSAATACRSGNSCWARLHRLKQPQSKREHIPYVMS